MSESTLCMDRRVGRVRNIRTRPLIPTVNACRSALLLWCHPSPIAPLRRLPIVMPTALAW